jgi:hypothetical protein
LKAFAQKVFSTNYSNQANIKVFVSKYENQAALKVSVALPPAFFTIAELDTKDTDPLLVKFSTITLVPLFK